MAKSKEVYESLFASDADWQNDACINEKIIHNLDLFSEGYKTAADLLIKHVVENGRDQDTLVYPIVYLYRQHIELRLKEIIREGNRLLNDPRDYPPGHELQKIWPLVKDIIRKVWPQEEPEEFAFIDHIFREIRAVDPQSDSFRYPEGTNRQNPLAGLSRINIRRFAEMMERVSTFLYGVSAAICDYNESC